MRLCLHDLRRKHLYRILDLSTYSISGSVAITIEKEAVLAIISLFLNGSLTSALRVVADPSFTHIHAVLAAISSLWDGYVVHLFN